MHLSDGSRLYSAKDLLNFLGCSHSSALDLQALDHTVNAPSDEKDEYLDLLKQKGIEHEGRYLSELRAKGKSVFEIARDNRLQVMAEQTREAMRSGVDVIYQGALVNLPWHGYSDFLMRVDRPSKLGAWSYEVADTKLARSAKPKHVLQLCLYSQLVALEQELMPERAHVVLGDGTNFTFRLDDYVHYCNAAIARFERFLKDEARETAAEPCAHCDMCRWSERCEGEWKADDHLSLVARMSTVQARKLRAAGITTLRELAELPEDRSVPKVQKETLERMRSQARLQYEKRVSGENGFEILPIEPWRGFARLPKPDAGDLFFDMEGDPVYSADGSLEYLFGFHYQDGGAEKFTAFWAHDRAGEKKAFEDALDFITDRLRQFPDAYVYHYAAYEETALRRLAQQYGTSKRKQDDALTRLAQEYGTRENEVDDLLRNRKLVDLYKVVREGVRVSEESYSLKNLEVFYAPERTENIKSGGDSIVAFERWLVVKDDQLLKDIEEYNAFDCRSTWLCRDWLLSLRPEAVEWFDPSVEKSAEEAEKEEKRRVLDKHILDMREALVAGVQESERPWRELLGFLLEYHRREARREWWDYFKRLGASVESLVDDSECIGGLTQHASIAARADKRSMVHTLMFPEQEMKLRAGKKAVRSDTGEVLDIVSIDEDAGTLELKLGPSRAALSDVICLIPTGPFKDDDQRGAVQRYAQTVIDGQADSYPAITSILRRQKPELDGGFILKTGAPEEVVVETVDAASRMRNTHLVIQGPPGTGKTYTSAHTIVSLLDQGKRVAVTALAHKAINNLLECIEETAKDRGVTFTGAKKFSEDEHRFGGSQVADIKDNKLILGGSHQLVAGTAWLFSQPELDQKFDYLIIEEASQVSLADAVAMGTCARNIILVGDQMQLAQPVKGAHPGGSGISALDYLMGSWATVPPEYGIFLAQTRRMHPDLCRFVSEAFYDGRLQPHPITAKQQLMVEDDCGGAVAKAGLRFAPVDHEDNSQRSVEEAARVAEIYESLIGSEWVNEKGEIRTIAVDDILVVSPYNMQVNLLTERLPKGARVGTVDRFQGQEAAVVLISMAASDGDQAPRGTSFLFSPNRMNVAFSRGRCLATVVASPNLTAVSGRTLEQVKLVNTMCWAEEWARGLSPASPSALANLSSLSANT